LNNPLKYTDPSGLTDVKIEQTPLTPEQIAYMGLFGITGYDTYYQVISSDGTTVNVMGNSRQNNGSLPAIVHKIAFSMADKERITTGDCELNIILPGGNKKHYEWHKTIYFPFRKGNKWEGEWVFLYNGEPIDWYEVGQRFIQGWRDFKSADWDTFWRVFSGSMKMTVGVLGTEIFGGLAFLNIFPNLTGQAAQYSWGLTVNALYQISNGKIQLNPMNGLYIPWR
jgi:hypothetical protein